MKKYLNILLFIFALTAMVGCHRDELVFPRPTFVELNIDWRRCAVDVNTASVIIYKDGKYFATEYVTQFPPVRKLIDLPVGHYDLIVHNEQTDDFANYMKLRGRENFKTLEVIPLNDPKMENHSTPSYMLSVDTLAVDRYIGLNITQDMINEAYYKPIEDNGGSGAGTIMKTISVTPRRSFTEVHIILNVMYGNGYYFTQSNLPALHGLAESYFMGLNSYSSKPVSHTLNLAPIYRAGRDKVVTYSGDMLAVGLTGRTDMESSDIIGDYKLSLPFVYKGGIDMREINLKRDAVSFKFTPEDAKDPKNNSDKLEIVVDIELEELILIGDVDVGVEDWTDVDIPLDGPQRLYFVANNGSKESFSRSNLPSIIINMPDPSAIFTPVDNIEFVGWNTTADGTGKFYGKGESYEMKRGGAIFYAIWKNKIINN